MLELEEQASVTDNNMRDSCGGIRESIVYSSTDTRC